MTTSEPSTANGIGSRPAHEHILFPRASIHHHAGLLARFLTDLRYEDIPRDALHMAKLVTLDTIGCIVAGTDTSLGKKVLKAYGSESLGHGCCVPGTSLEVFPSTAAKVNAWLSDVLDYEDVAVGHPSATVIPAALAMAEHLNATPRQFLTGVVAGYEAGLRVHDATRASPDAYRRFAVYHAWHGLAAGAAAMVVSQGSEEQVRSALGHAAANTNLPLWYVQYGRPAHALKANYGQMALGGVDAALCARQDIIGPFAMLSDPERGFAKIIGSDQFDPSQLSAGLAQVWRIQSTALKAYPCCAALHTTIDAIAKIVRAQGIDHKSVEGIRIRCFSRVSEWFSDTSPLSELDAQFSVQYASAMALLSIEPGREWYSRSQMEDAAVSDVMKRVQIEVDPVAEKAFWHQTKYMSSVQLSMRDGKIFNETVEWAPGHFERPFSDSDVEKKFLHNLKGTQLEGRGENIVEATMNMDRATSLVELQKLLRTPRT